MYNNTACFDNGINHALLLVGYQLFPDQGVPYWILRNSWGSNWGNNGYMKLAMQGGAGVCGVNLLAGYIPNILEGEINHACILLVWSHTR